MAKAMAALDAEIAKASGAAPRGGSALRGACRFNRVLVAMTDSEGYKAGVDDPRYYFRIGDVESNLAPPSSDKNQWFEKCGVRLPNGQSVGTLKKWKWPDAFDGITLEMAVLARDKLAEMEVGKARESPQASDWFGNIVARICEIEMPADKKSKEAKHLKSKVGAILNQWVQNDWIRCAAISDTKTGRDLKIYVVGDGDPKDV